MLSGAVSRYVKTTITTEVSKNENAASDIDRNVFFLSETTGVVKGFCNLTLERRGERLLNFNFDSLALNLPFFSRLQQ